jgi:hypothetical protein
MGQKDKVRYFPRERGCYAALFFFTLTDAFSNKSKNKGIQAHTLLFSPLRKL